MGNQLAANDSNDIDRNQPLMEDKHEQAEM